MGVLGNIARLLLPSREDYQLQLGQADLFGDADLPVEDQLRLRLQRAPTRSYRLASTEEALGVPAIMGAVSLIAATVGTLDLEAWKNSILVTSRLDVPRLIVRPNPLTKPFDFYRDTAYYLASRGEFWWAIVSRDSDGNAAALFPVPPWQIRVEANLNNPLRPKIYWNQKLMRNEDMVHHMYLPDLSGLRGVGPLQIGRAAASVAVEADAWAANFFSGALPSLTGTTDLDLDASDFEKLDEQWAEKDGNLPRWMDNGMKLQDTPYNPEKAQLTQSRQHQVGEVARLFNMPGSLLEYNMPGASLRYQNDEQIWTDFQRRCLSPHYLEPIEQTMGDLLPRSVSVRFNLDQLLRSDAKTRAEIYNLTVPLGIDTVEEARQREGKAPGNVNFMPVPPAPPAAIPSSIPLALSNDLREIRCPNGHLTGKASGYAENKCHRCGLMAYGAA